MNNYTKKMNKRRPYSALLKTKNKDNIKKYSYEANTVFENNTLKKILNQKMRFKESPFHGKKVGITQTSFHLSQSRDPENSNIKIKNTSPTKMSKSNYISSSLSVRKNLKNSKTLNQKTDRNLNININYIIDYNKKKCNNSKKKIFEKIIKENNYFIFPTSVNKESCSVEKPKINKKKNLFLKKNDKDMYKNCIRLIKDPQSILHSFYNTLRKDYYYNNNTHRIDFRRSFRDYKINLANYEKQARLELLNLKQKRRLGDEIKIKGKIISTNTLFDLAILRGS